MESEDMVRVIRIGKFTVPLPLVVLSLIPLVLGATLYAEMYGYLYIRPRPVAVWLTPSTYNLNVYSASVSELVATIENNLEEKTFEMITSISGSYYNTTGWYKDISPFVHVVYLDYDTRDPLPDIDADGKPEILSPVGLTKFYVKIIVDDIPDLRDGYASIYTRLEEFAS